MSGMGPSTLALPAWKVWRDEESARPVGICHVARGLSPTVKDWREGSPTRKGGDREVKALSSRKRDWREERLEKGGMGPERWLFWRERDWREERRKRSEGRVPERDLEERLMVVMWPNESQLTPCHLHGLGSDQFGGPGGLKDLESLNMMVASDEVAVVAAEVVEERERRRRRRSGMVVVVGG